MNYENLPDVLKKQKCFCLWKIEHRNGKKTKVPYQINGARARPNEPKTFSSFAEVMAVYLKGGYDGIGLEDAEEELRKMEDFRKAQEAH